MVIQGCREDNLYFHVLIALSLTFEMWNTLAAQAKRAPILRTGRHGHSRFAIDSRDFDLCSQQNFVECHGDTTHDIITLPGEVCMRTDTRDNVQVSGWTAILACLPFAGEPHLRAVIDTRRDFDLQALRFAIRLCDLHLDRGTAHSFLETDFDCLFQILPLARRRV